MIKVLNPLTLFVSLIFILFAYGNSSDKTAGPLKFEHPSKENQRIDSSNNCLEKFHGKPEKLLTKEVIEKFIDFEGADVVVAKVSEQIIRDLDFAQVNCKWKIGRQRHIIRLSKIFKIKLYESKTAADRFYAKYHTLTPKEQEELKKCYDSLVLNSDQLKQKENSSNAEILSEAIGFNFEYVKIEGIGDAAVWEYKINDLIVLVGDYQFTVNVDLNKGNDYDLEKAEFIAKAIIAKACH